MLKTDFPISDTISGVFAFRYRYKENKKKPQKHFLTAANIKINITMSVRKGWNFQSRRWYLKLYCPESRSIKHGWPWLSLATLTTCILQTCPQSQNVHQINCSAVGIVGTVPNYPHWNIKEGPKNTVKHYCFQWRSAQTEHWKPLACVGNTAQPAIDFTLSVLSAICFHLLSEDSLLCDPSEELQN